MKLTDIEYYEYECGNLCSVNGCVGHVTDIPISFCIGGIRFVVDGADAGDFPSSDKKQIEAVKAAVKFLRSRLTTPDTP